MASTLRGNSLGRDKKGTSPSTSLIKKSLKPSSSASSPSSSKTEKASSSIDVKPVPSYLKSTKKASLDLTKRSSPDLPQKTVINRRRSFDRPPPVSQVQKAIRNVPMTREVKPLRSTSFSHKQGASSIATKSPRPASDKTYARTTSALKEGRIDTNLAKSRNIIKKGTLSSSITPMTKKDVKKMPKSVSSESSIDQLVIEDDLVNMENIEVQSLPDMSEMPDINQELGDPTIMFTDVHVQQHVSDFQDNVDLFVEKTIEIFAHNESEPQPEAQNVEEQIILTAECHEADSNKAQNVEQNVIELVEEKKEEDAFEQESEKNEEETDVKDENPSVITRAACPETVKKAHIVFGKKEKQDYNDVIEETATKLMGRKNKVLALAGAFETVISLQDTSKN